MESVNISLQTIFERKVLGQLVYLHMLYSVHILSFTTFSYTIKFEHKKNETKQYMYVFTFKYLFGIPLSAACWTIFSYIG